MPFIPHPPCDNTGNLCAAMAFAYDAPERSEAAMDNVVNRCHALLAERLGAGATMLGAECPIPGANEVGGAQ